MLPELDILGFEVRTFGLMVLVAYVAVLLVLTRRVRELGLPARYAGEGALLCTVSGFVGARLYYVLDHSGDAGPTTEALLKGGGLTWYGGFVAGALAAIAYIRFRRVPFGVAIDIGAIVVAVAQAVGRIGCQLSGDGDYGKPSDVPWAMGYPDGTVPTPPGVEVHPTPLYEAVALSLIAWLLWSRRDRYRPGVVCGLYLVLAGAQRFLVEFLRLNDEVSAGLTAAQLISLAMIAVGLGWIALLTGTQTSVQRSSTRTAG